MHQRDWLTSTATPLIPKPDTVVPSKLTAPLPTCSSARPPHAREARLAGLALPQLSIPPQCFGWILPMGIGESGEYAGIEFGLHG